LAFPFQLYLFTCNGFTRCSHYEKITDSALKNAAATLIASRFFKKVKTNLFEKPL